jgi:hypothetical protein
VTQRNGRSSAASSRDIIGCGVIEFFVLRDAEGVESQLDADSLRQSTKLTQSFRIII